MFKKTLAAILALTVCIMSLALSVSAANVFSDVTEANYSWAVKEIEEMAGKGIIKGYNAKQFGPADNVTKIQSLLLCARILGSGEKANADFVTAANEAYEDALENYNTEYKNEIAFLLYKGVLKVSELSMYISDDNANVPLKRYEAATLMTKVMDMEKDALAYSGASVFTDSDEIPAAAKPYVNYVYSINLMLGVNKTATVNEFSPLTNVTRAQMAVLLYRMMGIMDEEVIHGTAESADAKTGTLMFVDESGNSTGVSVRSSDNVIVRADGFAADLSAIKPQAKIAIIKRGGNIYAIEAISVIGDDVIEGVVSSLEKTTSKGNTIKISPVGSKELTEYQIAADASVTYGGAPSGIAAIKAGQFAQLTLKGGKVIAINTEDKTKTVVGTVSEIILSPELMLAVKTSSGNIENYTIASDATATRNGAASDVRSVLVGDKVTLTLLYNQIGKIVATSKNFTATGTVEQILIATLPSVTLKGTDGNSVTYSIARDAKFTNDGKDATIYDLRLGANVTVTVEGETAVKVSSSAPLLSSVLTGAIDNVNSAYGFMVLNVSNPQTGDVTQTQVFLKKTGLKIIDSTTGREIMVSALKQGMNVSVTGVMSTGAFEATTVIVLP